MVRISGANMEIYTNHKSIGKVLRDDFLSSLKVTEGLTIATGYIDEEFLCYIKPYMISIAKRGFCKLLVGMIFHSGVTKKQKTLLTQLNNELLNCNSNSGVFISRNEYHGKVYLFEGEGNKTVYLGSSNLSTYGFYRRLECTVQLTDELVENDLIDYIQHLFDKSTTSSLNQIDLKTKSKQVINVRPSNLLRDYLISKNEFDSLPSPVSEQNIKLRVNEQPRSSLNLYFDKGRKNSQGQYIPRPWFEVELTSTKADRANPNYPMFTSNSSSSQSQSGSFDAYINEGDEYYKIAMKVHSDDGKNISSANESGGRTTLGRYIKGKLQEAGVLSEGSRITSETLELYEKDYITLKKIDSKRYILKF